VLELGSDGAGIGWSRDRMELTTSITPLSCIVGGSAAVYRGLSREQWLCADGVSSSPLFTLVAKKNDIHYPAIPLACDSVGPSPPRADANECKRWGWCCDGWGS